MNPPTPEDYARFEVLKDLVDEMIDLMLNYRQSGHPGGSRSKVHLLIAALLSGAIRWDLLRPWRTFQDRLVLSAGHAVPVIYALLAVLNEVMRERYHLTGDATFAFPDGGAHALTWEDLLRLRRRSGLPGHAEMGGKTLLLKWNTGPSGHGLPAAAGQALALRLAGAGEVKVFAVEGEGGLTPGASHETKNSAWGLGLDNLVVLVDWNDFGIDERPCSSVVHGTPEDWFAPYGWRVVGTERGMEWESVTAAVLDAARGENSDRLPTMAWFKTRKGRGYGIYDARSHGTLHPINGAEFWKVRHAFMEKYSVAYEGVDRPAPPDAEERAWQAGANFRIALSVLHRDERLVTELSDRFLEIARLVPDRIPSFAIGGRGASVLDDERLYDYRRYPESIWRKPGEKVSNRAALSSWGAWVNAFARKEYGRPLVIACSADLAESTGIAGFAKGFEETPGWGWYERETNPRGVLLPQEITEFTNAGLMTGLASVNFADDPFRTFDGFWGACSTYAAFAYLKYGPMRLFSQLAQDSELAVGKVIWVAGHSGPETAEDSRTHFGIIETGVTQLFPEGSVIDLHPWEHNEVPVVLAAALRIAVPIVVLHLTRPAIEIPDREALGLPSHFEAARGAYVMRDFERGVEPMGTVFVEGTSAVANTVRILPELTRARLNAKVVAVVSAQLFARQDPGYRNAVASTADRWDAMCVTHRAVRLMREWITHPIVEEYSLGSDWDHRWRTGGTVEEVIEEAHLDPSHLLEGIERFVRDRPVRLGRLREAVALASKRAP